ncbi:ATP-grasp domain-containing protein [Parasulfitobacter algicola]|uniref:ATP-grasp domain-containing protein n=1 Tax=Parasulfitobacter algicola TaxID=2614809 RepID=A0ABX2IVM2_9RHOB|nr:hypothetical protein [Sulfitobacter algicola]NSX56972.1 hypothetical protein [Sulfitobacter algicola]
MRIALIACAQYPELSASNQVFKSALESRDISVDVVLWNRIAASEMLSYDLCVFRQSWDYQDDAAGFASWVGNANRLGARFANSAGTVLWNNDKRTLDELRDIGVTVPWMMDLGTILEPETTGIPDRVVLKPAFGGSGVGVRLCDRDQLVEALADARLEAPGRPFFAQEFIPEISEGEWSATIIDENIAHCIRRRPASGEFRTNGRFKPQTEVVEAPQSLQEAAEKVSRYLGPTMLYIRLDGIISAGNFVCTELELTDPDLYFEYCKESAALMAEQAIRFAEEVQAET